MVAEVNEGWEANYQAVRSRTKVSIDTRAVLDPLLADGLITEDEYDRSLWKIKLIEPFLTQMVVNMIKGSLKYTTDTWDAATWQDMSMDDQADGVNYKLLFHQFLRVQGVID